MIAPEPDNAPMSATHPDSVARHWLAKAHRFTDEQRLAEAVHAFQQALAVAPEVADNWYDFGVLLRRCGQAAAAEEALSRAIALGLGDAEEAYLELALVHADLRQDNAAAEVALRRALALRPAYVPAWLNLGNLAEDRGDRNAACDCYRSAIAHSARGSANEMRALSRMLRASHPRLALDDVLSRADMLLASRAGPAGERADLAYALGHHRERQGEYAAAFDLFVEANRSAAEGFSTYAERDAEQRHRELLDAVRATPIAPSNGDASTDGSGLLFIVGMFRSGSTLLEQMLTAHPQIASIGESPFFPRLAAGPLQPFPESLVRMGDADTHRLAGLYLAQLESLADPRVRSARIVADKRPDNVSLLPLIKRVFPRARVLVTRRHPLDNGLSVFQHHLDLRHAPYGGDLRAIGHHIGLHQQLIAACQERFGSTLKVVDYETLVADPEAVLRPLLAWLELDWTPECLDFHRSTRAVRTASVWQVREPVHGRAKGRWRVYADRLGPLVAALDKLGVEIPGE